MASNTPNVIVTDSGLQRLSDDFTILTQEIEAFANNPDITRISDNSSILLLELLYGKSKRVAVIQPAWNQYYAAENEFGIDNINYLANAARNNENIMRQFEINVASINNTSDSSDDEYEEIDTIADITMSTPDGSAADPNAGNTVNVRTPRFNVPPASPSTSTNTAPTAPPADALTPYRSYLALFGGNVALITTVRAGFDTTNPTFANTNDARAVLEDVFTTLGLNIQDITDDTVTQFMGSQNNPRSFVNFLNCNNARMLNQAAGSSLASDTRQVENQARILLNNSLAGSYGGRDVNTCIMPHEIRPSRMTVKGDFSSRICGDNELFCATHLQQLAGLSLDTMDAEVLALLQNTCRGRNSTNTNESRPNKVTKMNYIKAWEGYFDGIAFSAAATPGTVAEMTAVPFGQMFGNQLGILELRYIEENDTKSVYDIRFLRDLAAIICGSLNQTNISAHLTSIFTDLLNTYIRHSTYSEIMSRVISRLIVTQNQSFAGKTWYNFVLGKYAAPSVVGSINISPNVRLQNNNVAVLLALSHEQTIIADGRSIGVSSTGDLFEDPYLGQLSTRTLIPFKTDNRCPVSSNSERFTEQRRNGGFITSTLIYS